MIWEVLVTEYTILDSAGNDVTDYFTNIKMLPGSLTVTPAELTVTTGSAGKMFDGTPLTNSDVEITGLAEGENIKVTATGSITDPGTTDNTFTIDWRNTEKSNYTVIENLGKLVVDENDADLIITADSAEKVYDGTELTLGTVTVVGLPEGFTCTASVSGTQTVVGSSENAVTAYSIRDEDGKEVNGSFRNISVNPGTLTVTPAELTVTTGSARKAYDGKALTEDTASVAGFVADEGKDVSVKATGTITNKGTAANTCTIDWGTTDKSNYTVFEELGTLEVTANDTAITFTADTAEKVYDGTALTTDTAAVTGLPEGFSYTSSVDGAQTDAGSCDSIVTSYKILDKADKDVTDAFTGITTVKGTLTVTPAELTVTTGSASKEYDGKPLTNSEASITGLAKGETAEVTATGTITEPGTAENIYSISWGTAKESNYTITESLGTLEVTTNDAAVTFTAPDAAKVYDGTALTADAVTASGLPEGVTYTCKVTGTQTDAGTSDNVITSYTILNAEGEDVTKSYTDVTTKKGTLTVTRAELKVTTGSSSKKYDGKPLTNSEASITGLAKGETAEVTATGTITEPGTAENTCSISWGTAKESNYTITESLGTLEVTTNDAAVTFTAPDAAKVYDGTALTADSATASGLPEGVTYTCKVSGTQTDAGTSDNVITSYTILNAEGKDVTSTFTNIKTEKGTLTVTPAEAAVTTGRADKKYDGTALTKDEASITGLIEGETATVAATGSITDVGKADNTYSIAWGTAKESNYTLTENLGTLEITKNDVVITFAAPSASKVYDGTALTAGTATVTGLPEGVTYTCTVEGTQTDAGSSDNVVTSYLILDAGGKNVTGYFTKPNTEWGTLTVTKAPAKVTTGSASKMYDGTPLTNSEASITGLADGETATVKAVGSITDVGTVENTYTIDWGDTDDSNYTVTEELGTLEVTESDVKITITADSAEKPYDGTPLTVATAKADGLPEGYSFTCTVSGSQTAVGSSGNTVTKYTILNADGQDVTESFTGVETKAGTLEVTAAELTVTAGSASKPYDGTALTCSDAEVEGLAEGETITVTTSGSITDVGTEVNTFVIDWGSTKPENYAVTEINGLLDVTENNDSVSIKLPDIEVTYTGNVIDSETPVLCKVVGDDLGEDFYAEAVLSYLGYNYKVGSYSSDASEYTIYNKDGKDVTDYFTNKSVMSGTTTVVPAEVTITTGSAEKVYDGTALTSSEASISGLVHGETAVVSADGSITDAGTTDNTYTIDWGSTDSANYTVTEKLGKLTITSKEVIFDLNCYGWEYDGVPWCPVDGINGTYKDGGEVTCSDSVPVMDEEENYVGVEVTFTLMGTDQVVMTVGSYTEVGTYTVTPECNFTSGEASNYKFSYEYNTFEIEEAEDIGEEESISKVGAGNLKLSGTGMTEVTEITEPEAEESEAEKPEAEEAEAEEPDAEKSADEEAETDEPKAEESQGEKSEAEEPEAGKAEEKSETKKEADTSEPKAVKPSETEAAEDKKAEAGKTEKAEEEEPKAENDVEPETAETEQEGSEEE